MVETLACKENMKLRTLFKWIAYKRKWRKENENYFDPDGLCIFVGPQGSGKTLSAVNYVYKLLSLYPDSKLVTNVALTDYPVVTFDEWLISIGIYDVATLFVDGTACSYQIMHDRYVQENRVFPFSDNDDFQKYYNGQSGVIFLVDEIQLYMNSLESKNINIDVVTQISQQRKQRKHIVATSQVFGRMAKPLREQFSCVILCKAYWRCLQANKLMDRDSLAGDVSTGTNLTGEVKDRFFWFHDPAFYGRYDTSSVVQRGKFVGGEKRLNIDERGIENVCIQ